MHYSILPINIEEAEPKYVEMEYKGVNIVAVMTENGYQIERLNSADYTNFMDESLMPGTTLENSLINRIIQ